MSEGKPFKTGYGFPSPPVEPVAWSLSPDTALLNWKMPANLNAPIGEIRYKLSSSVSAPTAIGVKQYDNGEFSPLISDIVSCNKNPCQAKVPNLRASTTYQFWITALHISRLNSQLSEDTEATSTEAKVQTKDVPGILRLDNVTSSSVMLRWNWLNPSTTPADIFVQYKQVELPQPINTTYDPQQSYPVSFAIEDLHSATTYDYRYKAVYTGELAYDTLQQQFVESCFQQTQQARTKAGTPSAPLDVEDKDGSVLKWSPPKSDGGEPITSYAVEFRPDSQSEWEIAERGLPSERFVWRIRDPWVSNGDSSSASTKAPLDATTDSEFRVRAANVEGFGVYGSSVPDDQQEMDKDHPNHNLWMYIILSILCSIMLVCVILFVIDRHRKLKRMRRKQKIHKVISLEDIARQIQVEVENEIRNLPHVHRSCIHPLRNKILGKGSFGEVVEGIFRETDPHLGPQDDKGYLKDDTEENRLKFLKEAVLMNNFDHPNIIKLLGVYRESQPNFLVFELMEGGDFGLARDMFSSDYYKVHGADFLPLRWLSPESAIQGIFTSKSDVWAFGIVLWEIMTFGSQPYTGITNLDVLIRLKEGKPPERPHNCPDEIYEIMALAWTFSPEKRPKFVDLLSKLEILRSKQYLQPFPWTAVNSNNASSFTNNAFDNSHDSISSFANPSNASGSIKTIDGLESQGEIHARFDKSENRSTRRHGRLPKLLKPDTKSERPGSSISAETEVTTLDYDYEIPRNRTVNRQSPYISSKAGPSVMGEFLNEAFVGDASLDSSDNLQPISSQHTNYSAFSNSAATVPSTPECSKSARILPLALNRNFAGESNSIKSENGGSSSPRRFATSASSAPLPDSPSHRVTRVSRV
ncbi:protein tyrosine kinase domain-containing protein [Ditylenchus destructor]|nr:protein tyrosine kinase domain-containing protein [Ditylenchus destructor]